MDIQKMNKCISRSCTYYHSYFFFLRAAFNRVRTTVAACYTLSFVYLVIIFYNKLILDSPNVIIVTVQI